MSDQERIEGEVSLEAAELDELASQVRAVVDIADRKYGLPPKTYPKCFVGDAAVSHMVAAGIASDVQDAVRIGNLLLSAGIFHHVQHAHPFKNEYLFYRFAQDEDHGEVAQRPDGSRVSWADFLAPVTARSQADALQPQIPERDRQLATLAQDDLAAIGVQPLDEHNSKLLDNAHPKQWSDPVPKGRYNIVVIGGGTGGLVTASASAGVGGRAALIESHLLGGDCLNVGCVPSKALLRCAKLAAAIRDSERFGISVEGKVKVDFGAVMERMRRLRASIAPVDSASRYADQLGVDVFIGRGRFTGPDRIEVNGQTLHFSKAVIATGGTAAIPDIEGLAEAPYLTNANIFNLTELPPRLGVIGAGPIGLELAQAFQRFGSQVTVFSRSGKLMPKEDPEAVQLVAESLERDGLRFEFGGTYRRVESRPGGPRIRLTLDRDGASETFEFDELLLATGRKPSVKGLGLEQAGVDFDERMGVRVDDHLRTSNKNIFAVGDVASKYQFTHVADFMARIVVRNALFFGRDKFSQLLIPWATYTDPEVAHVGLYERDLQEREIPYTTFERHFDHVDRAIVDGETEGFVKIHVKKGSDEILGATIVGSHAGDLISEISVAMRAKMGLGTLANVIHPYPTVAEAIRHCGDAYNRTRLTPTIRKIFYRMMSLQR